MSNYTTNYNLIKPEYSDDADIGDINGNMDIIDSTLAEKQNATDNNLTTTSKQVVGAINELDSEVGANTAAIGELDTQVDTNTDDIATLKARIPVSILMANVNVTTTSGVGQVTFAEMAITGKTLLRVMATVNYSSASGGNLYASCQVSTNHVNVYLRNGVTGGLAANGTYSVTLVYMYN